MNKFLLLTSRKVLPTLRTFCPNGVQNAQTVVHFAHFRPGWQHVTRSRCPCTRSSFSHWGLNCNPLVCCSASVLHSRSTRYNWDQPPDINAVTWCPSAMHAVKFLYTATFYLGLKIATLCFRQMYLPWLGPSCDITRSTVRLLWGASCL